MSCFHGKDGIVYGKAGQELAMSQSRRFQNVRNGDGSPSWVWSGSGWPRCRSGLRPEMTPRWANYGPLEPGRKKCRILFVKCHVVKLWRVLHCFQEERLNSLSFHFPPSPPLDSCCIVGILPLDGDKRQDRLLCSVKLHRKTDIFLDLFIEGLVIYLSWFDKQLYVV